MKFLFIKKSALNALNALNGIKIKKQPCLSLSERAARILARMNEGMFLLYKSEIFKLISNSSLFKDYFLFFLILFLILLLKKVFAIGEENLQLLRRSKIGAGRL